jgi:hypothetical protein
MGFLAGVEVADLRVRPPQNEKHVSAFTELWPWALFLFTFKESLSSGGPLDLFGRLHRPHPKALALKGAANSLPSPAKRKKSPLVLDQRA